MRVCSAVRLVNSLKMTLLMVEKLLIMITLWRIRTKITCINMLLLLWHIF